MDSTYGPRPYNKSNKVLPLSQSQQDQHKEITPDDSSQNLVCSKRKSTFKTSRIATTSTTINLTILSSQSISLTTDTCDNVWNENKIFIESKMDSAYIEIVYWKKVYFLLPTGAAGKGFIIEMTKFVNS